MPDPDCVPPTGAPLVGRAVRLDPMRQSDAAELLPVRLVADSALGAAGTVVGSSSLGDVDVVRQHVHLGWTMYGSRWWGTAVNPETKLLLLSHVFETCGFGRVKIQTDIVNTRSRAAIVKLGASLEGVTRRDSRRADGSWRDSAVYSILVDEWPVVRTGLLARLGDQ